VNPVARLGDSGILLSSRSQQRPDLLKASSSLGVGGLDRVCYLSCCCYVLDWCTEYLKVVRWREQLTVMSSGNWWTLSSALVERFLHLFEAKTRGLQGLSLSGRANDGNMEDVLILARLPTRRSSYFVSATAITGRAVRSSHENFSRRIAALAFGRELGLI
jgi:hypothetical protein